MYSRGALRALHKYRLPARDSAYHTNQGTEPTLDSTTLEVWYTQAWHGQLSAAGSEELEEAARRVEAALAASLPAGSYRVEARDVGRYG